MAVAVFLRMLLLLMMITQMKRLSLIRHVATV